MINNSCFQNDAPVGNVNLFIFIALVDYGHDTMSVCYSLMYKVHTW